MQQRSWHYKPFPQAPFTPEVPYSGYGALPSDDPLQTLYEDLADVEQMLKDPDLRLEVQNELREERSQILNKIETLENLAFRKKAQPLAKYILPAFAIFIGYQYLMKSK